MNTIISKIIHLHNFVNKLLSIYMKTKLLFFCIKGKMKKKCTHPVQNKAFKTILEAQTYM